MSDICLYWNIYIINAEYGEINEDNPDIIFLKNVKAKISIVNSEDVFIESDFANRKKNFTEKFPLEYVKDFINRIN